MKCEICGKPITWERAVDAATKKRRGWIQRAETSGGFLSIHRMKREPYCLVHIPLGQQNGVNVDCGQDDRH